MSNTYKKYSAIKIARNVTKDLRRLSELNALLERDGGQMSEYALSEIETLRKPLLDLFLPVLKMLVGARAIAICSSNNALGGDLVVVSVPYHAFVMDKHQSILLLASGKKMIEADDEGGDEDTCDNPECACHDQDEEEGGIRKQPGPDKQHVSHREGSDRSISLLRWAQAES